MQTNHQHIATRHDPPLTRREMLARSGTGFGMLALAGVLAADDALAPQSPAAGGRERSRPSSRTSPARPSGSSTCS